MVDGPVLALDYGDARVGLAASDDLRWIARPLETVRHRGIAALCALVAHRVGELGVGLVVVGDPISMDGTVGPRSLRTRRFAGRLAAALPVPVVLWDEAGSTARAIEVLHLRGSNVRREKKRGGLDRLAAAVVLQEFLDAGCPAGDLVEPASPPPSSGPNSPDSGVASIDAFDRGGAADSPEPEGS